MDDSGEGQEGAAVQAREEGCSPAAGRWPEGLMEGFADPPEGVYGLR